jgi:uncharacterized membrane protein YeaQ/YmgE (transglycosylase-associated protein family)
MSQLKVLCFSGIAFSLVFSGFSLVFYFGDWSRLILVACFGLFIGFLAAPEFAPKAFKKAWVIQLICGAIAGAIVGMVFNLNNTDIASASIIGGFIGWSANLWIKHVPIP